MFDRDKYIPVLEKIVRDAKIKERYENAMELLYKLTNDLDAESINKSIALAKELLYGAKASRPILENLIDDLEKLADEHEQQELNLSKVEERTTNTLPPSGVGYAGVIVKSVSNSTPIITSGTGGSGKITVKEPEKQKPAGVSGDNVTVKITNHTEQPNKEEMKGGAIGALQRLGQTFGRFLTGEELARGGIVTMTKEEHEQMHRYGHERQSQILEMVSKALNTVKELRISREALHRFIENDLDNIEKKFAEKNKRYGQDQDGFYNFTQGAKLHYGDASPNNTFRMLMAYTSKHIVALEQPDALTNDDEFEERCLDVAVYMMIARAMKKATREGANNG